MAKKNTKEKAIPEKDETEKADNVEAAFARAETLVGDVRDAILDTIKAEKENKAWAKMTEDEQAILIERCADAAENLVRQAVRIIAAQGFKTARAAVDNYKGKDGGLVLTLKMVETPENLLSILGNQTVTLIFANDDAFDQQRTPCKPDPDQAGLALDGANDEDADFEDAA